MKSYNVCKRDEYKGKVNWNKIGVLFVKDGGKITLKLSWLDGIFSVFENKPKEKSEPEAPF